jgi:diguanylate cyclase (GGDEF)-like protein
VNVRNEPALTDCDREPIHIPGSVQSYGVLFAFDSESTIVAAVSENVDTILERKAEDILGYPIASVATALHDLANAPRAEFADADRTVFNVTIDVAGAPRKFLAGVHYSGIYTILEIEPAPAQAGSAQWKRSGSAMLEGRRAFTRMCAAKGVRELCDLMAAELARVTGYDRTMVYRFGDDGSGEVLSEVRSPKLEAYLGLRYPATDIPVQARRLYLAQTIRYIADVNSKPAALVPQLMPDTQLPLDLSATILRSSSPVHLEYLRNMGVGSTVVMSLVRDGALWGMLVAHNSTASPCPPATRGVCDFLGMLGSSLLIGATELEAVKARDVAHDVQEVLVARLARGSDTTRALSEGDITLANLIASDGFAIGEVGGAIRTFGKTPAPAVIGQIVREIQKECGPAIAASDAIGRSWPALASLDMLPACGILFAPVFEGGSSYVAWFRNEKIEAVRWAGDPSKASVKDASGRLRPRNSFALWVEEVRGRSERWSSGDREAAGVIREHLAAAQLRLAQAQLARLASFDELTGLANRRVLHTELDRIAAGKDDTAALIFIDLDRFKSINDGFGHDAGDEFLVSVAARLTSLARPGDIVARFGGDEFIVLCHHCPPSAAAKLANRIVRAFDEPFIVGNTPVKGTASVGWAIAKTTGDTSELLRRADLAMYYAKRHGGNQAARSHAVRAGVKPAPRSPRSARGL